MESFVTATERRTEGQQPCIKQTKAFAKGVNPNVNELYKEAVAKATAKEKCKVMGKVDIQASGQ